MQPGDRRALNAYSLNVGQAMLCTGLKACGEIHLSSAHVGGSLDLKDARLDSAVHGSSAGDRRALDAYSLSVGQSMLCTGLKARGELHLSSAHIGGSLNLDGARLLHQRRVALNGYRLGIDGAMMCNRNERRSFARTARFA